MHRTYRRSLLLLTIMSIMALLLMPALAQDADEADAPPPAEILNDEGGPVMIVGETTYTFPNFNVFFYEPFIVMSDAVALIERDPYYETDEAGQVFGKIVDDAFSPPFNYELSLPIEPRAELRNVANINPDDPGVMIFALGIAQNMIGDPFQEERDFITGLLSSVILSPEREDVLEVIGGKLLVWSPDDQQGFPAGFGEDGRLFTDDDPIVILPQGYTVVDMNQEPFTFDRSRIASVPLNEPAEIESNDFSNLSYVEAFDEMIELFRLEYAFTDYKDLDWDAISAELRPRIEEAQASRDVMAYRRAIRDFAWSIPDGHIFAPIDNADFNRAIEGGLGLAIREVDDGRVIVNFLTPNGPAEQAGIELRAEILEINGQPIEDAIEATQAWSAPFSTQDFRRLQQLRYVTRYPIDMEEIVVVYRNPGDDEPTEVTLRLVPEQQSFSFSSFNVGLTGTELPVEFRILDNGYGYIRIYSFSDDLPLTFRLWERALATMRQNGVPGIVIDMRQNGGGSAYMADQLPAYFFDEELELGFTAYYSERFNDFYYNEDFPSQFVLPPEEDRYHGAVAVLVAPACQSACESFSYNMARQDRAAVVGHYTTSGLGGSVVPVFLPDGVVTTITNGRGLDADGEINIEGIGVPPTIRVPVTEETLFSDGDPLLDAAIAYLDGATSVDVIDGGTIVVGDTVTGDLEPGSRVQYQFVVAADTTVDFLVDSDDFAPVFRVYIAANGALAIEEPGGVPGVDVPGGLELILEVGSQGDTGTGEFTFVVRETGTGELEIVDGGEIALGDSVQGELAPGVRVVYTLVIEEDAVIDIAVGDDDAILDTYLRVYVDGATEPTFENDDIDPGVIVSSALIGIEVSAGQTLAIEVAGFADVETGEFTLVVIESNGDADEEEVGVEVEVTEEPEVEE